MPDKTCPSCGRRFGIDVHFCQDDGTPLTLAVGAVLAGRYEIVRELGRGAMGVVYLARETELGGRPCAVKILRVPAGTSKSAVADSLARLKSEARVLGSLGSHPNLVTVYTAGQDDHGLTYVVMEYVEGESLKVKLGRGTPFNALQTVRIIRQIAEGLAHAHSQNIIHRDLKPGNLILTGAPESQSWVKIVDFGIAKAVQGPTEDLTVTGGVVGTPRFMSPEQRAGKPLDHRSDIFALALIAAELLSDDLDPMVSDDDGDLSEAVAAWPNGVKEVLARGLAQDPENRPGSALAFARDLEAAVRDWEREGDSEPDITPVAPRPSRGWLRAGGAVTAAAASVWALSSLLTGGPAPEVATPQAIGDSAVGADAESLLTDTGSLAANPGSMAGSPDTAEPSDGNSPPAVSEGDDLGSRGSTPPDPAPLDPSPGGRLPVPEAIDPGPALAVLRARVDPDSPDTTGLALAVLDATRLLNTPGIADSIRTEVRYLRAEARLMAGEAPRACEDLETIRVASQTDRWVAERFSRAVGVLLDLHCDREQ